jgi:DNA-binding NtrC family response regulator
MQRTVPEEWILVIDDDKLVGRAIARWIKQVTGLETRLARTIDQAEECAAGSLQPAAIVTDYQLESGEDGVQAIEHLRSLGCRAPAALLTGAPELAIQSLERSTLDEVVPVFSKTEMQERLKDWLEQVRLCWVTPSQGTA